MRGIKKSMLLLLLLLVICSLAFIGCPRQAGGDGERLIPGANVPRNQTLILENAGGVSNPPNWFNRWSGWSQSFQGGLQQIGLDALWFIDPNEGIDGVWFNSLASEPPIYNSDFTQLTIRLRQGIYWSDGVQFTADDVIFTIESQIANPGMHFSAQFSTYVERVVKVNDFELRVHLLRPNSRFHSFFVIRWGGCFIMPAHIASRAEDLTTFDFNPLVSLGPYVLRDYDPLGNWHLWEKRDDWHRTTLAVLGSLEHAPRYVMYVNAGTSDVKVMSMRNLDIDVIHDLAVEGVITLRRTHPTATTWFPDFPWGHPDPTLVSVLLNNERPGLNNRDVRWALALSLDMVRIAMASYRGAMTVSAIHIPPTGMYPYHYFQPLEQWLRDFTLDLGDGTTTRPYNPNIALEIAAEARRTLGDMVPTNENLLRQYMGAGWWHNDLASAEKLMVKGGMRRNAQGIWQFANGQPFQITLMVMPEGANPSLNRAGAMLVENWREFGIDVVLEVRADFGQFLDSGDYDAVLFWNIETWGGHPDLSFFLSEFHSSQFVPSGEMAGRNTSRWRNPQVDRIVEELQRLDMEHPRVVELGREFVQIALYDMFQIPISSYNVFSVMDTHFWTGFPSINDPFANPVCNWTNWRYIFLRLRPTGR